MFDILDNEFYEYDDTHKKVDIDLLINDFKDFDNIHYIDSDSVYVLLGVWDRYSQFIKNLLGFLLKWYIHRKKSQEPKNPIRWNYLIEFYIFIGNTPIP